MSVDEARVNLTLCGSRLRSTVVRQAHHDNITEAASAANLFAPLTMLAALLQETKERLNVVPVDLHADAALVVADIVKVGTARHY